MALRGYSKQKVIDEYMQDYNPYEKHELLQFDLRGANSGSSDHAFR